MEGGGPSVKEGMAMLFGRTKKNPVTLPQKPVVRW